MLQSPCSRYDRLYVYYGFRFYSRDGAGPAGGTADERCADAAQGKSSAVAALAVAEKKT